MRAWAIWCRSGVLATLLALLAMHGVSAGHEAMASMSSVPSHASMSAPFTLSVPAAGAPPLEARAAAAPSLPAGLLATTCLALLSLGVVLLLPRTGRRPALRRPTRLRVLGRTRVSHWPRGPDPVAELCTSRT